MNKLIQYAVMVAVGVLIFSALLIPVINGAREINDTFHNDGAYFVEVDPADTYTLKYQQYANPGKVIVNGEELPITFNQGYTLLRLDNVILRLVSNNQMQLLGGGSSYTDVANVDITVTNGTVSGTLGYGNPITTISWPKTTYSEAFIISATDAGEVMKSYNTPAKVNADSPIDAYGVTTITGSTNTTVLVEINGTIADGVNVTLRNKQTSAEITTMTVSDVSINYTAVSGYIDLYDLTSITFKVTNGEYLTDVTYSAFVVPSEVTAERTVHADDSTRAILGVIPLIVIIGLIAGIVGVVAIRRNN